MSVRQGLTTAESYTVKCLRSARSLFSLRAIITILCYLLTKIVFIRAHCKFGVEKADPLYRAEKSSVFQTFCVLQMIFFEYNYFIL